MILHKILLILVGLTNAICFLQGFSKISKIGRLEHWTFLLISIFSIYVLSSYEPFYPNLINWIIFDVLIILHAIGYIFTESRLNLIIFRLMNKGVLYVDWNEIKSNYLNHFKGDAKVTKHSLSVTDNAIAYELQFIHPVSKGWYYAMFHRSIICLDGVVKITFKKNNKTYTLNKGDILEVEALDIIKLETITDSKIRVICTR